ncbi:hypothetical protein [Trichocoleus sp. FACHB-262]|uniref:hypothetical protein n=1 Tax=Trichocoleus sp. FACHB-262 TaxID=2692869 RepID=UPI0016881A59|nr:hypothetical protein [Trichocoleus sp. FACHB-262]MBD2121996.1 hypothetical protein [Trichocoleus sp. FACHB-262]
MDEQRWRSLFSKYPRSDRFKNIAREEVGKYSSLATIFKDKLRSRLHSYLSTAHSR